MPQHQGGEYRRMRIDAQIQQGVSAYRGGVVADLPCVGITGDPALLQTRGINQNANVGVVPFLYALII